MFIDLHIHSYFSDGTFSPEQVAHECKEAAVGLASLTDHNTWSGSERFEKACAEIGVETIRGAEFDCLWKDWDIHILGYGFEATPELCDIAVKNKSLLLQMSIDLLKKMKRKNPEISLEEYEHYQYNITKGGWAGIHYLLDKGIVSSLQEGMSLYAKYGLNYNSYSFPPAQNMIDAITRANGIPILAHPGNYFHKLSRLSLFREYDELTEIGIQGIELFHPRHSNAFTQTTLEYIQDHPMLVTSGSDSHGLFAHTDGWEKYQIGCLLTSLDEINIGSLLSDSIK